MPAQPSGIRCFTYSSFEHTNHAVARRTPRRQIRKQRPERASQSAVKAPQQEPGGRSIGAIEGDQGSATPSPPGPTKNLRIEANREVGGFSLTSPETPSSAPAL